MPPVVFCNSAPSPIAITDVPTASAAQPWRWVTLGVTRASGHSQTPFIQAGKSLRPFRTRALVHEGQHAVDIAGYFEAAERCRAKFKGLRILTGIELGEPHWFPKETADMLAAGPLDRVHGSIHCIRLSGGLLDASQFRQRPGLDFPAAVREYFRETLAMVDSGQPFETLAHLDYPKRYWLDGLAPYRE